MGMKYLLLQRYDSELFFPKASAEQVKVYGFERAKRSHPRAQGGRQSSNWTKLLANPWKRRRALRSFFGTASARRSRSPEPQREQQRHLKRRMVVTVEPEFTCPVPGVRIEDMGYVGKPLREFYAVREITS